MAINGLSVRRAAIDDFDSIAALLREGECSYERVPIDDARTVVGTRYALIARAARGPVGTLISLWPDPPYVWLDALAVASLQLADTVVAALLDHFISDVAISGAQLVLFSTNAADQNHDLLLRAILGYGFCRFADFRRFHRPAGAAPALSPDANADVRPAVPGDVPAIHEVERRAFVAPWRYGRAALRRLVKKGQRVMVVEVEGRVAGYCASTAKDGTGHISRIAVHPRWRRRGLAALLLVDALRWLEASAVRGVELYSEHGRRAAWNLFESFGFRSVDFDRRVYAYELAVARRLAA